MPCDIVVGTQWGDEGKAKIIDFLSEEAGHIARFQGGANAGHTVIIGGQKFVFHLVPSGILHPNKVCLLGSGMVVDPLAMFDEIKEIESKGIDTTGRVMICGSTNLLLPYHRILDTCQESRLGNKKIGTTGKGIGPAYTDKAARKGVRVYDIVNNNYQDLIRKQIEEANFLINNYYKAQIPESFSEYTTDNNIDPDKVIALCDSIKAKLSEMCVDGPVMLQKALKNNEVVLAEGAQGTGLDINFGTYPFVTSSHPISGGACVGLGLGPKQIRDIYGIMKCYVTRVGSGPFPTELDNEDGETLRKIGGEFGATTGRPRRCGWFDGVFARYACAVNSITRITLTKLDVLDEFEEIQFCTAYEVDGKESTDYISNTEILAKAKPVYKSFPGWQQPTSGIKKYEDLPQNARNYIEFLEKFIETPVYIVSVGPDREETIIR